MAKSAKKAAHKIRSKPKKTTEQSSWRANTRIHLLSIFVISFLLYANTLGHQYTQDDAIVIYDNMFVTQGVRGIPGILKYDTFYGFFKEEGKANLVVGGRYRPLSLIFYALEVQLFAPKKKDAAGKLVTNEQGYPVFDPLEGGNPNLIKFIGHLGNVLFFSLTAIVLYLLLLKMLAATPYGRFVALATTLLFIVHPIHTEVVANIKGRDEILTLLGSLSAAYFLLRAYQEKKMVFYVASGILFFLGLMAKENAITFLGVMPLIFYYFTKARPGTIGMAMIPLILAAAAFLGIRGAVLNQRSGNISIVDTAPKELMNNPFLKIVDNRYVPFSESERLATITFTLGKYVQLLFWPHPLTHDYYPRQIPRKDWGDPLVWISLFLYVALLAIAILGIRNKRPLSFGIFFYLGTLFLVSNFLFPIGTNMAERFLFMPSVGYCFAIAYLIWRYSPSVPILNTMQSYDKALLLVGGISIALAAKTFVRNQAWESNYTLFTTDIETSSNSAKLRHAVGGELVETHKNDEKEAVRTEMLNEAIVHLKEAVRIHPAYKNAYLTLGNAYYFLDRYDDAIQAYNQALLLDPDYKLANKNLGYAYREAGKYYGEQLNDLNTALQYLQRAEQLLIDDPESIRLLGVAHGISGNNQKAISYFQKLVELQPDNPTAFWNLANAYRHIGNTGKEQENRQKALALDPDIQQKMNSN